MILAGGLRRSLYLQVIAAMVAGVLLGIWVPEFAVSLKFLGDAFVSGMKVLIGPLVFVTMFQGISGSEGRTSAARVGWKALLYFEGVSTAALAIGLLVGNLFRPGAGFPLPPGPLDPSALPVELHPGLGAWLDPRQGVNLLQVLLLAVASGAASLFLPASRRTAWRAPLASASASLFRVLSLYLRLAPLGAGAAMAFTVGKFGLTSLSPLLGLLACFYLTCAVFVVLVLGGLLRGCGVPLLPFLRYLRSEILLVVGTSSSESALAPLMQKLSRAGCGESVVGLVVPTGYSMNLDGTNIYLTLGVLFLAQAFQVDLSLGRQLMILGVAMFSSKGASGVTGAGFVTLAATLSLVPEVPAASVGILLGIDRFMSEARAITNMLGNGVATVVISHWEGEWNREKWEREISRA